MTTIKYKVQARGPSHPDWEEPKWKDYTAGEYPLDQCIDIAKHELSATVLHDFRVVKVETTETVIATYSAQSELPLILPKKPLG